MATAPPPEPPPGTATAALLALDGVTKRFGRVLVADALSLAVPEGQALGIVGPNGAGKTSLFSLISGDLRPDAGEITFAGRPVTRLDPAARCRLGLGRTYQVPRPFEHMSTFENVLVSTRAGGGLGGRPGYARAADVLATVGLHAHANTPAGRLPLLHRKRLELARALGGGPRLLLLDEVAGGLTDPEVDDLLDVVAAVRATGVTIIWIEHVVHALVRAVDRLLCLAGGRFIADGTPADVLASAAVREVYLGSADPVGRAAR